MSTTAPQTTARDVMTAGIVHCAPETGITELATTMTERRIHAVVVSGIAGDHLVWGVVSDRDVLRATTDPAAERAEQIAATEALTVDAGDGLDTVARRLSEHDVSHAIVVEGDRPVGILSTLDVLATIR